MRPWCKFERCSQPDTIQTRTHTYTHGTYAQSKLFFISFVIDCIVICFSFKILFNIWIRYFRIGSSSSNSRNRRFCTCIVSWNHEWRCEAGKLEFNQNECILMYNSSDYIRYAILIKIIRYDLLLLQINQWRCTVHIYGNNSLKIGT